MYHGVHATAAGPIYRAGLALLDLENPRLVVRRSDEWIFGPSAPYEIDGDVGRVVFPCGWVLDPAGDVASVYYGAGDSVVGLATVRLDDLLASVLRAPAPRPRWTSAIVDVH
jgi:predicted GH43/DUF377 family glycosyl hydrolase